jgi:hypothetical protein
MKNKFTYVYLGMAVLLIVVTVAGQAPSPAKRLALQQMIQSQRETILRGIQNSPSEVKQQVDAVPAIQPAQVQQVPAPPPASTVAVVSDSQKDMLVRLITNYAETWNNQKNKFSSLATGLAFAGVGFALLATISSYISKPKLAGILGIVTTAVIGLPRVYPAEALADFYRSLSTHATTLQTTCTLKVPFTVDDYKSASDQIQLLISTEGTKQPHLGSAGDISEDLAKQLPVLKTEADTQ